MNHFDTFMIPLLPNAQSEASYEYHNRMKISIDFKTCLWSATNRESLLTYRISESYLSLNSSYCIRLIYFLSEEDVYQFKVTRCIFKTPTGSERAALNCREGKITDSVFPFFQPSHGSAHWWVLLLITNAFFKSISLACIIFLNFWYNFETMSLISFERDQRHIQMSLFHLWIDVLYKYMPPPTEAFSPFLQWNFTTLNNSLWPYITLHKVYLCDIATWHQPWGNWSPCLSPVPRFFLSPGLLPVTTVRLQGRVCLQKMTKGMAMRMTCKLEWSSSSWTRMASCRAGWWRLRAAMQRP